MKVLVTGSSGLIGSTAVRHWDAQGAQVIGVDNDMRGVFFGDKGSTLRNLDLLKAQTKRFESHAIDVRDREAIFELIAKHRPELVIHCAAQPSHDKAREIPLVDFEVNAVGTLNMLEGVRRHSPDAVFCHMSTNKVYGDAPNEVPMTEHATRFDYSRKEDHHGIDETCRIDRTLHSVFGASKTAADVMAQEYGRYYGLKVGVFRGGCLTGRAHCGVELHGFLSYLVHVAVHGKPYTIFGYGGKQVRDQIDSTDVIAALEAFSRNPRPGEVYNLGGGRANSASVLECIDWIEKLSPYRLEVRLSDQNRVGDHICYISDCRKLERDYPEWRVRIGLEQILHEMIQSEEIHRAERS
ncbi:MAG: NAD-dependent epimerase/dehydratase family protein [Planctomycetota bacterium]